MEVLTLDDVYYCYRNAPVKAIVKLGVSGIGIKAQTLSEIQTIKAEDIKECVEHYGVISHVLRITKKDGSVYIIDGISADSVENIRQYTKKHYKMNVYSRDLAVDGNVHGKIDVLGSYVEMKVGDKTVFEIPLSAISNAYERRGEGIIDINEAYYGTTEIRFGSLKEESNVLSLVEQIKSATGGGDQMEVLSLDEVTCILPRGKSKMTLTSSALHLVGKTYSHQILFDTIGRSFFLERNTEEGEEDMFYLILELKTPIRQGQTRYYFVSLLLPTDHVRVVLGKASRIEYEDEESVSVVEEGTKEGEAPKDDKDAASSSAEEKKKIEELGLSAVYENKLSHCILEVLETLGHMYAIQTGKFSMSNGNKSLKCSSKANEGYLYPLKKGFLFIPKIVYVEYTEIAAVEFSRVNLSTRTAKTFDVRLILENKKEHMFNGIQKTEFSALETYLGTKGVKCRSEVPEETYRQEQGFEEESEEETASDQTSNEEESASSYNTQDSSNPSEGASTAHSSGSSSESSASR